MDVAITAYAVWLLGLPLTVTTIRPWARVSITLLLVASARQVRLARQALPTRSPVPNASGLFAYTRRAATAYAVIYATVVVHATQASFLTVQLTILRHLRLTPPRPRISVPVTLVTPTAQVAIPKATLRPSPTIDDEPRPTLQVVTTTTTHGPITLATLPTILLVVLTVQLAVLPRLRKLRPRLRTQLPRTLMSTT